MAVMIFIEQARAANIPLTGSILQKKAKLYAEKLGVIAFKASWLAKSKKNTLLS